LKPGSRGNLLDTSIALIAISDPVKLSPGIRKALIAGPNFLSVVAYWEVMLKSMKGKLDIGDPRAKAPADPPRSV
jgi:PIN domain nuclease of toxin-antitoxin system